MCLISNNYNPKCGPIIEVIVFPYTQDAASGKITPVIRAENLNRRYTALLDTGADVTMISNKVIQGMPVSPRMIGMSAVTGVIKGAVEEVPVFAVAIGFHLKMKGISYRYQAVRAPAFGGIEKSGGSVVVDVLIGMDILSGGFFSMDSKSFSFRFPELK